MYTGYKLISIKATCKRNLLEKCIHQKIRHLYVVYEEKVLFVEDYCKRCLTNSSALIGRHSFSIISMHIILKKL